VDTSVQTKEKVLSLIQEHQDRIKALGVKKLGLFGSFFNAPPVVCIGCDQGEEVEYG